MIVCAGESESFEFAKPVGIGLIQSAINLTKICLHEKPKEIIFIGTAGSYGKCEVGKIYESSHSSNVEIGFYDNLSYTPLTHPNVSRETSGSIIINSSNYITTDEKVSKQFLENGFSLENMEFFAIQSVAKHFNIKSRGVFYVTNYCNKFAHEEFIKNHKNALHELTLHVKKWILP